MKDGREIRPLASDDAPRVATVEDQELNTLLRHWRAPRAPESMRLRMVAAYRLEMSRAPLWRRILSAYLPILSFKRGYEEANMKQCSTCFEEFTERFTFCPVDGTPLNGLEITSSTSFESTGSPFRLKRRRTNQAPEALHAYAAEYRLTIIEDAGLVRRLQMELREVAHESQLTWPEFKRDPVGFTRRSADAYGLMLWRFFSSPNVAIATMTSLLLVLLAVIGFVALDRYRAEQASAMAQNRDDLEYLGLLSDIPADQPEPEKGTAGLSKGAGGGSKPKQEKPGGGGGGGRQDEKPASFGKVPEGTLDMSPIVAANPKQPPPTKDPLLVTPTLDADPLLIPRDDRPIAYGDNKSISTDPSSGPGTGNGIGTGEGVGIGPGQGGGYGPGYDGNTGGGGRHLGGGGSGGGGGAGGGGDYSRIFNPREVTQKAKIISKPEPGYTEEARKNQISGTVTLRAVLSSSGAVTSIRPVSSLPFGLTEKAISAARQIKFIPAQKDGRAVSQYVTIEYNFNIY